MDTTPAPSSQATFGATAALQEAPPKPLAVLLMQILCGAGVVYEIGMTVVSFFLMPGGPAMMVVHLFSLAFTAAMVAWFGCAFLGAQRGETYGRLLGLSVLIVLALFISGMVFTTLEAVGGTGRSDIRRTALMAGGGVLLAAIAWWIRAYGFSKAARAWFSQSRGVEVHLPGWDA